VEFRALPSRAAQALRIASAQLRYWRLPHLIDPAAGGIGELLAYLHRQPTTDRHCTLRLVLDRDLLTVSVRDVDPPQADVARPRPARVTTGSDSVRTATRQVSQRETVCFTLPAPPNGTTPPRADVPAEWRLVAPV
jgi:hypothetical protein